jgi:RalA-binding protein 1
MSGMKADLDKTLEERDKYLKRLKEISPKVASPVPMASSTLRALRQPSRGDSVSSILSEDELPIQRHSVVEEGRLTTPPVMDEKLAEASSATKELIGTPNASALPVAVTTRAASSPTQTSLASSSNLDRLQAGGSDSCRTTIRSPMTPIAPLEIHKRESSTERGLPGKADEGVYGVPSPASFAARRSFTDARKMSASSPTIGPGSPVEENVNTSPTARRGPPARLNLHPSPEPDSPKALISKTPEDYGTGDHTDSDYEDIGEVDEIGALQKLRAPSVDEVDEIAAFERGRKKTREADDRERELFLLQEQESRSRSKKHMSKSASRVSSGTAGETAPILPTSASQPALRSPDLRGFASTSPANSRQDHLSPHASLAGILSGPPSSSGSIVERTITLSPSLASPGLPLSPRPADRHPHAAIPRSPRDGIGMSSPAISSRPMNSQPLSPRPPRQPIPLPSHTPQTLSPPFSAHSGESNPVHRAPISPALQPAQMNSELGTTVAQTTVANPAISPASSKESSSAVWVDTTMNKHSNSPSDTTTGGVYRGLVSEVYPDLLLPPNAIPSIMIRVTSSRLKPSRHSMISPKGMDDEPVFTLGVSARSDRKQLWRVEKAIMSLPQLEQQLKQVCAFDIKLPDRSLFSGQQSPAKIDARREALEKYFEAMLDTPMAEKAALLICQYLSTQVVPAEEHEGIKSVGIPEDHTPVTFGADGKVIKEGYLTKRGKQFGGWKARFFVLDEPILRYYDAPGGTLQGTIRLTNAQIGRQNAHASHHSPPQGEDPDNQFRHAFLILEPKKKDSNSHMKHVLCAESDEERDDWVYALLQYVGLSPPDAMPQAAGHRTTSQTKGSVTKKGDTGEPSPEHADSFHSLQGTSYEETTYAEPPSRSAPYPPMAASPSNATLTSNQNHGPMTISKPSNGTVIQDATVWGNKAPASPRGKEKEQKKRSIWGFRSDKLADIGTSQANSSNHNVVMSATQAVTRNVFGAPLNEAVEYCMARGSNVPLPSVVYRCIEYLDAKGAANEEGLFRLSGSNVLIKQLKEKFNTLGDFDFLADDTYYDVHAVASLLKLYLRELPSMVLTRELHVEFLQYMECNDKARKIAGYNMLVHKLPLPNWTLVRALSQFLISIVSNSNINKMNVRNVGIVFAPTLNMPAPIFATFLTDFDAIFVADPEGNSSEPSIPAPLTPEDIRSPRRQLFSEIPTPSYQQDSFPSKVQQAPQARHYDDPSRNRVEGQMQTTGGFVPVQPAYEPSYLQTPARGANRESVLVLGPEMVDGGRIQYGSSGGPSAARDNRARRRESSMMFMGGSAPGAHRQSSMPSLGQPLNGRESINSSTRAGTD